MSRILPFVANGMLGAESTIHITGGSANFVLATDGTGNLSWANVVGLGASGFSGWSGKSGYSGVGSIGASGYSGTTGASGYPGKSGYSGTNGASGFSGTTGASGYSGQSGTNGASGYSGISGYSGASGFSGKSGFSGESGYSGISGAGGPSTTIFATDDSSTNPLYPVMVGATGSNQIAKASSTKLKFNASTGNLNATLLTGNGLAVNGVSDLGNISNVVITGGTNGFYIQTDGVGNLSWVVGGGTGNGVVGGANTQIQFNNEGNFAGNVNFTFDKVTSNVTVPEWINSPLQNNNAYMTGWTNSRVSNVSNISNVDSIGITSLFVGYSTQQSAFGEIIDIGNSIYSNVHTNIANTATLTYFGANTSPRPGVAGPMYTEVYPNIKYLPIQRSTAGNAVLLYDVTNNTFNSVTSISSGGKNAVLNIPAVYYFPIKLTLYTTDNTASKLYTYALTPGVGWTTSNITYSGNYHVTDTINSAAPGSDTSSGYSDNAVAVLLNKSNNAGPSQWAIISNSNVVVNHGNISSTGKTYDRFVRSNGHEFFSYSSQGDSSTLGSVATLDLGTYSPGPPYRYYNYPNYTFHETLLPTVTSNASTSFAYDMVRPGTGIMSGHIFGSCKDIDIANSISNTYFVEGAMYAGNSISWGTVSISANIPTSFDFAASNTMPGRILGIQNFGTGTANIVQSLDYGNTWTIIAPTSNSYTYLSVTGSSSNTLTKTDIVDVWLQATPPDMELGISSAANTNYNFIDAGNITYQGNSITGQGTYGSNVAIYYGKYKNLGLTGWTTDIGYGSKALILFIRTE